MHFVSSFHLKMTPKQGRFIFWAENDILLGGIPFFAYIGNIIMIKMDKLDEVSKIERIIVKHPNDVFANQKNIEDQWRQLNYQSPPDYTRAVIEYDRFLEILNQSIAEVLLLPQNRTDSLDSIYVRDTMVISEHGLVLCNMGKAERRAEPEAVRVFLEKENIPIVGEISGDGRLEGGDLIWLDNKTLAVGRGYRTNDSGIRQLGELCGDGIEIVVVPLPHWRGKTDVMHLMSLISPIDSDLAVVYSPLLPVPFREWLLNRGIKLIEVPDSEFESMGCNILTLAPRKCLLLSGNNQTRKMLEAEAVEVIVYDGENISLKGSGGPTCLTRPLERI